MPSDTSFIKYMVCACGFKKDLVWISSFNCCPDCGGAIEDMETRSGRRIPGRTTWWNPWTWKNEWESETWEWKGITKSPEKGTPKEPE